MQQSETRSPSPAPLWLALGSTFLGLLIAFAIKSPCTTHPWDGYQYSHYCYNDLQPLYHVRGVGKGLVPYRDVVYEFPPLTGMFMDGAGRVLRALEDVGVANTDSSYFRVSIVLMAPFALATTLLLRPLVTRNRLLIVSLGTPVFLYAFMSWDMLAVAGATWGLAEAERKRAGLTGAALALGASAKLFPLFLLPAAVAERWISRDRPGAIRMAAIFTAVAALVNVPWMFIASGVPPVLRRSDWPEIVGNIKLRSPSSNGWFSIWTFHAGRYPDFDTLWYWLAHHGRALIPSKTGWWDPGSAGYRSVVDVASLVMFAGAALLLLWWGWRRRAEGGGYPVASTGMGIVACFLLLSKVHSPQYALWLLPFLALLNVPPLIVGTYFATDLAVFLARFNFYQVISEPAPAWKGVLEAAVISRAAALVAIAWWALSARRVRPSVPEPEPATS